MAYLTKIKEIRENHNMTQKELADILKTTQPQYHRYETGERDLPLEKLVLLCRYFNVSADYILGLPEEMPSHSKAKKNT